MGIIDFLTDRIGKKISPEEYDLDVSNNARQELIDAYGPDRSGTWIDAYERQFIQLMNDPDLRFLERLGNKGTHAAAIAEIQQKLYR